MTQQKRTGKKMVVEMQSNRNYRNPRFMEKDIADKGVFQYGTCFPGEVWDPKGMPQEDFLRNVQLKMKEQVCHPLSGTQQPSARVAGTARRFTAARGVCCTTPQHALSKRTVRGSVRCARAPPQRTTAVHARGGPAAVPGRRMHARGRVRCGRHTPQPVHTAQPIHTAQPVHTTQPARTAQAAANIRPRRGRVC
jgi:hypothetical protein